MILHRKRAVFIGVLILRSYLVLLQPLLQQLLAALLQDGPAQLQRLKPV